MRTVGTGLDEGDRRSQELHFFELWTEIEKLQERRPLASTEATKRIIDRSLVDRHRQLNALRLEMGLGPQDIPRSLSEFISRRRQEKEKKERKRKLLERKIEPASSERVRFPELRDLDYMRSLLEGGATYADIARLIGCSATTVQKVLEAQGLTIRRRKKKKDWSKYGEEWEELYKSVGSYTIGLQYNAHDSTVRRVLARRGVKLRKPSARPGRSWKYPELNDRDLLFNWYHVEHMNCRQISEHLKCGHETVQRAMKYHGIKLFMGARKMKYKGVDNADPL